jgi:hypothetical protein
MHGDDPASLGIELIRHARVLEPDKGEAVAGGIGERESWCAVVLVALLAAVEQDAIFRHLAMSAS